MQIDPSRNWGDIVSFILLKYLSNSQKLSPNDIFSFDENAMQVFKDRKILAIGSSIEFTKPNDIVWGTGCIAPNNIGDKPNKIYAVRGPLTRQELLQHNIDCPEVYGDPALLFPKIYNKTPIFKYKYGVIPHYIDFTDPVSVSTIQNLSNQGVKVINITSGVFHFIDELLQCANILSSSLHGLIMADAYGIPNIRIKLSNKLIGGDFKFNDYFLSVGRESTIGEINNFKNINYSKEIKWDENKLLESGPWNDPKCKFF